MLNYIENNFTSYPEHLTSYVETFKFRNCQLYIDLSQDTLLIKVSYISRSRGIEERDINTDYMYLNEKRMLT